MEIYIISFTICVILAYIIPRITNKKYLQYILLAIIILILSIIAGGRDFNIGTDIEVYGRVWFERACKNTNLFEYLKPFITTDKGYLVLNFLISRFTNNVNIFLFMLQLITNTLVITTLFKYKDKIPFWLSLLCFLGIYYLRTYNYMRQSVALAIIFFCIRYIDNRKMVKYIIGILIASTFHFTALIAIILYPLSYMIGKNKKVYNYIIILGLVMLVIITFNIVDVIRILYDVGIINDKIYNYTDEYLNDNLNFNKVETLFRLFFILLYIREFNKINDKLDINKFLFICLILDIMLYQFSIFMSYSNRIALYFGYMSMLIVPQLPSILCTKYKDMCYMKALIALIVVFYWYWNFIHMGICEVYPYTSKIFGIGI